GGAELLDGVGADVVVGHDQAVGRDERGRAADVEADRGLLDVLQPLVRGLEVVVLFEVLTRRLVEQPHALVGAGREEGGGQRHGGRQQAQEKGLHGVCLSLLKSGDGGRMTWRRHAAGATLVAWRRVPPMASLFACPLVRPWYNSRGRHGAGPTIATPSDRAGQSAAPVP